MNQKVNQNFSLVSLLYFYVKHLCLYILFLDRKIAIDALEIKAMDTSDSKAVSKVTNIVKRPTLISTQPVPTSTEVMKKEFVAKVRKANVLFSK